jgi:hypothetical protein
MRNSIFHEKIVQKSTPEESSHQIIYVSYLIPVYMQCTSLNNYLLNCQSRLLV